MRLEEIPFLEKHQRHDALVVGHNGTTQSEVVLLETIAPLSVIVRNIAVPWLFMGKRFSTSNKYWLKFLLDFTFVVVPSVLSVTILSERIALIFLAEAITLISLLIFYLYEYCCFTSNKPQLKIILNQVIDYQQTPTIFISYLRSMVLIWTGIAIMAVDFEVFPRRFAKTERFGRSLMDVGTASFVFCSALIDAFRNYSNRPIMQKEPKGRFACLYSSSTAILLYLGVGRSVILKVLDYPEHVTEYGVHWNFFITLACIRVVTKLLGRRFHLLFGILLATFYQLLLQEHNLQAWLLSDSVPRNDFVSANREGIYSLLGYLALYYLSSVLGSFISSTGIRLKSWIYRDLQLLLWTLVLFALQKLCESLFGPPSRRIVNAPYIIEMLVFHTFMTAGFLFVQLVSFFGWAAQMPQFKRDENAFELLQPCLLRAINKNAMYFFIIANVLTGVVNMLDIPSKYSGQYQSTACITLYILIVCASIFALSKRRRS